MSSSSSSRDFWLFNTMLVENEYGGEGTGLLVFRPNKTESKIGDQINVIGYPAGIRHRMTNFPIIRSGIISSMIGEELQDEVKSPDGKRRKRILRGFLVDGAIIPGSSGSPVVLPPVSVRNVHGRLQIDRQSIQFA